MTIEENASNRQTPTYARRGSPLTCFGVNGTDPCLFYKETGFPYLGGSPDD
jgi:hypothetical protein